MTDSAEELSTGTNDISPTPSSGELIPATPSPPTEKELALDLSRLEALQTGRSISVPSNSGFSRKQVVEGFHNAFEIIGGVPRLALWANENYGDFVRMYSKLLPSQNSSALGESGKIEIELKVPGSRLDDA